MPEIKNTFLQGKMNKDLDERLVPNGQYRDAVNIEISTSEGSDVGAVKNILGNKRIENIVPEGFKCVGSIANEKTNKLYWFISKYEKDAIIEHDIINDKINPVIVDLNAGNSKAVLKFSGNIITGINIINNLLFWTDNNSEPKKINIDECKKGTPDLDTHTQLIFENGSFDGITLKYVAPSGADEYVAAGPDHYPKMGAFFWFEQKHIEKILVGRQGQVLQWDDSNFDNPWEAYMIRHYRNGKFLGKKRIRIWNDGAGTYGRRDDYMTGLGFPNYGDWGDSRRIDDWHVGDIIFGDDIRLDIEERHITVIKPKPLKAPTVKINHTQTLDSPSNIPNLFETTFPRFSYRYKYKDGEFSVFAPFTEPVFNPKYTKDINSTSSTNVFYTKDNVYDVKDPHNKAMVNSIHSVELTDFITTQTPEDAIEIEVLYKQENSSIIYSIDTIKQTDPEWHDWSNHEGHNIGFGKTTANSAGNRNSYTFQAMGGYTKGKYTVTTENIHAALPANQLLRPWDNVPRKALGQEITGNRIVYGNYLQNYNLGNIKPEIKVNYNDRSNQLGTFENKGLPSVKSQRNYQLGIVYCDKYGRETPVFTSKEGAVNIPWQKADGTRNASKSLQLNASVINSFPEWVDSFKIFIKETSSPYYNLVMDKAWVAKSTYELDRGDHLWISFPSSDTNKISIDDYIILKKKIGTGEEQVAFENKFKVIDVVRSDEEVPDAIKYELVNYGIATNTNNYFTSTVDNQGLKMPLPGSWGEASRIDKEGADDISFDFASWRHGTYSRGGIPLETAPEFEESIHLNTEGLYVSWRRLTADGIGVSSKKYKVTGGRKGTTNYLLKLSTPITKIDADIAHLNGDSSDTTTDTLHANLIFQIEKKELKDSEDFSGKFFVKISKNQITDLIEEGSTTDILDNYIVSAKTPTYYWHDDENTSPDIMSDDYGITNHNGFSANQSYTNDHIQIQANNGHGNTNPETTLGITTAMRLTDSALVWDGILDGGAVSGGGFGPIFFIDSMHMVAGQSEASNYAKYCCVTWAGAKDGNIYSNPHGSAWSYPPLKMWLTDWMESENVIENLDQEDEQGRFHDAIASGLIETSPVNVADDDFKLLDEDENGVKVTGWVGGSQAVDRTTNWSDIFPTHVNGLEGIVTTVEDHVFGPRRWFSGITGNPTDHGVGVDTKTYSDNYEIGRHFMHLSFLAPGKDLHDGTWSGLGAPGSRFYGAGSWAANLQGIWGGGVFTGGNSKHPGLLAQDRFGSDDTKYASLPMEGNHDSNNKWLPETPGPGVGFGYDTSKNYQELHERQWDPTFNKNGDTKNKIRDFIRNLHAGSQFKFSTDPSLSPTVYTIKKVVVKKLYNHTSWRTPFNRDHHSVDGNYYHPVQADVDPLYKSVEEVGLAWLDQLNDSGQNLGTAGVVPNFQSKIVDFGKASNRRLCYIIELDKNPTDSNVNSGYNPIHNTNITADLANGDFANIEFIEKVQSTLLAGLNKFPAIWEIDPKKQEADLDIYYEASNNIPVKLNKNTNELIAPIGCKVEMIGVIPMSGEGESGDVVPPGFTSRLLSWDGTTAILDPGFPVGDGTIEIEYSGFPFKFTKEDGSYVILTADEQQLLGQSVYNTDFKTDFVFRHDVGDSVRVGLAWYNCFSFGNGLESNRIRDDYNEMYIGNGVKASTTIQQIYEEEHRAHGLIYSGLYNSNTGVNDLNQFIMAEKITKDLNPTFGSIQKLFQRRISLIAFCEDKVVSITSNKDALYNADGNPQLVATNLVLGDANPFVGEYGISKNPESFASESYRAYFTDKQRGAVIRLSKDGLTPISKAGMHDYFRDNLQNYDSLIGSYDSYKEDYNITLSHKFGENFIYNSYFDEGVEITPDEGSLLNFIQNPGVAGENFQYAYQRAGNTGTPGTLMGEFEWGPPDTSFGSEVIITNHPPIGIGDIQTAVGAQYNVGAYDAEYEWQMINAEVPNIYTTTITTQQVDIYGNPIAGAAPIDVDQITTSQDYDPNYFPTVIDIGTTAYGSGGTFAAGNIVGTVVADTSATSTYDQQMLSATLDDTQFEEAEYEGLPGSDDGWWYNTRFDTTGAYPTSSHPIFGFDGYVNVSRWAADEDITSRIRRVHGGVMAQENAFASTYGGNANWASGHSPVVQKRIYYPIPSYASGNLQKTSQTITRNGGFGSSATNVTGTITFDRPDPENTYVEFRDIGKSYYGLFNAQLQSGIQGSGDHSLSDYNSTIPLYLTSHNHSAFFNGDEIHIQFELTCFVTMLASGNTPTDTWPPDNTSASGSDRWRFGYNYIMPKLELHDGYDDNGDSMLVPSSKLVALDITDVYNPNQFPGGGSSYSNLQTTTYNGLMGAEFHSPNVSSQSGFYQTNSIFQLSTVSQTIDNQCILRGTEGSASVTFPDTSTISALTSNTNLMTQTYQVGDYAPSSEATVTIVCGASFKFRDGSTDDGNIPQQDTDGTPLTTGANIIEKKVINDLRIRISNAKPKASYSGNTEAFKVSSKQLWEINNLKIKKGFGVTAPHTAFDPGTILTDQPGYETTAYTTLTQQGSEAQYGDVLTLAAYGGYTIPAVPAIPATPIPGWVEVVHQDTNYWNLFSSGSGGGNYLQSQGGGLGGYGPTYTLGAGVTSVPYSTVSYTEGATGYTTASGSGSYLLPGGSGGINYPSSEANVVSYPNTGTPSDVDIPDQYLHIEGPGAADAYAGSLKHDISSDPWVANRWYLVDIEYDENYNPNTGDGVNSEIQVFGVGDPNGTGGGVVDPEGVGRYVDTGNAWWHGTISMEQVDRTEYGSLRPVLRAIFKLHDQSERYTDVDNRKEFTLRFQGFGAGHTARLTKLIVKRMDAPAEGGTADNWWFPSAVNVLTHSFSKKKLYYKNGLLNWDMPGNGESSYWGQSFATDKAPQDTPGGWKLKFTVGANTDSGFNGSLNGYMYNVLGDAVDGSGDADGIFFENIEETGEYEMFFRMDGGSADHYINRTNLTGSGGDFPYTTATLTTQTTTDNNVDNRIVFYNADSNSPLRASISNLSLIDQTLIFQGGTSGSWNWDGFYTSLESYIYWDDEENDEGIANNRIQFGELVYELDANDEQVYNTDGTPSFSVLTPCPFVDPESTATIKTPISANQWVNRTINRYETYEISFTHGITQGRLSIYYFNSEGFGFKIPRIGSWSGNEVNGVMTYKTIVTIGAMGDGSGDQLGVIGWNNTPWHSEKRSATHPAGQQYQPELQETFVIAPSYDDNMDVNILSNISSTNEVVGWIDNVTMTRVYNIELNPETGEDFREKTVTFSEDVNGWTSFKSFVPESGVSLSKKYFTFDEGKLYRHYVPLKYNWVATEENSVGFIPSTVNDAENYNVFYGNMEKDDTLQTIKATEDAQSKIKFVLNNDPSVVKTFNTLNYEGTQTHVKVPVDAAYITINNAEAWQKQVDTQGWNCYKIESDLDAGSVTEFIKKEGKWFNYIKGKSKSTQDLDTSRFSVQGIGIVT